jgi:hypothetical protein
LPHALYLQSWLSTEGAVAQIYTCAQLCPFRNRFSLAYLLGCGFTPHISNLAERRHLTGLASSRAGSGATARIGQESGLPQPPMPTHPHHGPRVCSSLAARLHLLRTPRGLGSIYLLSAGLCAFSVSISARVVLKLSSAACFLGYIRK